MARMMIVKRTLRFALVIGLSAAGALAYDVTDRGKLFGSWELDMQAADSPVTWTLMKKENGAVVTNREEDKIVANYECKLDGSTCQNKVGKDKVELSMWFNGPKLVLMETKGDRILKRRFHALAQGDVLELEIIPLVPDGQLKTLHFKRVELSAPRR